MVEPVQAQGYDGRPHLESAGQPESEAHLGSLQREVDRAQMPRVVARAVDEHQLSLPYCDRLELGYGTAGGTRAEERLQRHAPAWCRQALPRGQADPAVLLAHERELEPAKLDLPRRHPSMDECPEAQLDLERRDRSDHRRPRQESHVAGAELDRVITEGPRELCSPDADGERAIGAAEGALQDRCEQTDVDRAPGQSPAGDRGEQGRRHDGRREYPQRALPPRPPQWNDVSRSPRLPRLLSRSGRVARGIRRLQERRRREEVQRAHHQRRPRSRRDRRQRQTPLL